MPQAGTGAKRLVLSATAGKSVYSKHSLFGQDFKYIGFLPNESCSPFPIVRKMGKNAVGVSGEEYGKAQKIVLYLKHLVPVRVFQDRAQSRADVSKGLFQCGNRSFLAPLGPGVNRNPRKANIPR